MIALPFNCANGAGMLAADRVPYCAFCNAVMGLGLRDVAAIDAEFDKADRISRIHQAYRRKHRRR